MDQPLDKRAILIVEDDYNDRLLMKTALERAGVRNRFIEVGDGGEALDYLEGKGRFADRDKCPIPYLMILNRAMLHVSGFEVLKQVRTNLKLCGMIVIMVTSSNVPDDISMAYRYGVNGYLVKQ